MNFYIFLDDERHPPEHWKHNYVVIRDIDAAKAYMLKNGVPNYISFDHDLGGLETGYDLVKWMIDQDMDRSGNFIPQCFIWFVHSQNPVGKENINKLLSQYMLDRKSNKITFSQE